MQQPNESETVVTRATIAQGMIDLIKLFFVVFQEDDPFRVSLAEMMKRCETVLKLGITIEEAPLTIDDLVRDAFIQFLLDPDGITPEQAALIFAAAMGKIDELGVRE